MADHPAAMIAPTCSSRATPAHHCRGHGFPTSREGNHSGALTGARHGLRKTMTTPLSRTGSNSPMDRADLLVEGDAGAFAGYPCNVSLHG